MVGGRVRGAACLRFISRWFLHSMYCIRAMTVNETATTGIRPTSIPRRRSAGKSGALRQVDELARGRLGGSGVATSQRPPSPRVGGRGAT